MSNRRAVCVTFALLCAFILTVTWVHKKERPPNERSIRPYLQRYVTLLNARDTDALRGHLHSRDAVVDAPGRIAAFGGQGWSDPDVSYESQFYGVYRVVLTAVRADTGAAVTVTESLYWDGHDTWTMGAKTVRPEDPDDRGGTKPRSRTSPRPT